MKTVRNSDFVTKIAVFLFTIFCAATLYHASAAASQIAVEVNDNLSDTGNRELNQLLISTNPDNTGAGYPLAQAETGIQATASKRALDRTIGDLLIAIHEDWIYYSNSRDGNKLYRIKTNGSSGQKLNDDCSGYINVISDRIYYSNYGDVGKLYAINTDASGRQKLSDD